MIIKEMSIEQRPRERLERFGVDVLSEAELLAIVLNTGTKSENVIDMSHRLIKTYGVDKLSNCSLKELQAIKGIGRAKACKLLACFELNKRKFQNSGIFIKTPNNVFDYLSPKMSPLTKEHFVVLHLNSKNMVLKEEVVSIGTLNSALIHPREIFKSAIKESANSIILVHNHPSGDATPSPEDYEITSKLVEAGKLVDINVLDHVVIGKDDFRSAKC